MLIPSTSRRAGFARQGAKEKQLLKEGNAFNVSSFVLRAMMSGQYWPEGDEVYHAELAVPVLLVHGMHDKFVPVEEDQRMAEVRHSGAEGSSWCRQPSADTFPLADPADRFPEGDRRGQPHGDDGVPRDREHPAPRIRPVGARNASWGRARREEIRWRGCGDRAAPMGEMLGSTEGFVGAAGRSRPCQAWSWFCSRAAGGQRSTEAPPGHGRAGPALGTRQTRSCGSRWSAFILFCCSILFFTQ